jgi:hypothetical protein
VESIHSRCAGLNVHKRSISACIGINEAEETQKRTPHSGRSSLIWNGCASGSKSTV